MNDRNPYVSPVESGTSEIASEDSTGESVRVGRVTSLVFFVLFGNIVVFGVVSKINSFAIFHWNYVVCATVLLPAISLTLILAKWKVRKIRPLEAMIASISTAIVAVGHLFLIELFAAVV